MDATHRKTQQKPRRAVREKTGGDSTRIRDPTRKKPGPRRKNEPPDGTGFVIPEALAAHVWRAVVRYRTKEEPLRFGIGPGYATAAEAAASLGPGTGIHHLRRKGCVAVQIVLGRTAVPWDLPEAERREWNLQLRAEAGLPKNRKPEPETLRLTQMLRPEEHAATTALLETKRGAFRTREREKLADAASAALLRNAGTA